MRFDVFTIFPDVFHPYINTSIIQRAITNQIVQINLHNIRDWTTDKHHTTDDTPFGGGGGMVMKPEPLFAAVEGVAGNPPECPVILMSPQGSLLTFQKAKELSQQPRLAVLCGRYEGVDERVIEHLVTEEISIGDYVLSGGELPALVLIEALTRLLPGALGDPDGAHDDSFASGLLEYPHYTRPAEYRGWKVPEVLLNGNHKEINRWRRKQALKRTLLKRLDMIDAAALDKQDLKLLIELSEEILIPAELMKKIKGR
ncbi:MAG: tRNA (guanosine(37)-N1)-methyltransferase TrmD [Pelolinea sp.]|nr:tRNA (guanosine(37)-N1)-methyltransferase TrmD [Pelolinea sp.]